MAEVPQRLTIYSMLRWTPDRASPRPKARKRLVAVADVLGFSTLTSRVDLPSLAMLYRELIGETESASRQRVDQSDGSEDRRRFPPKHAIFSDTILIWSEELPDPPSRENAGAPSAEVWDRAKRFFKAVIDVMQAGLERGLPIRVGIAFGDCVMNRSRGLYLGTPIVDAYLTEQRQDWVGLALHHSVPFRASEEALGTVKLPVSVEHDGLVFVDYPVPLKDREDPPLRSTLNWLWFEGSDRLLKHYSSSAPNEAAAIKWTNTIKFFDACLKLFDERTKVRSVKLGPGGYEAVFITDKGMLAVNPVPEDSNRLRVLGIHEEDQRADRLWISNDDAK